MLNLAKGTVTNRRCALHIGRYTGFITLVLAVNQILPTSAYADDPAHEAEHDVILHMNEQIQELQAKVKEGNILDTDVERLLLQYKHNDYLNFCIGRYHSSIGYYNTAFHQGAWFQTTIDRPFMYASDDEDGFLPLQEVGATINGQIPSGKLGLNYVAEIGNGRARLLGSEPAQSFRDTNNGKSFNLALFARPSWTPGLQTGFSIYHDYLTFSDNIDHSELISTAYAVYESSNYEFLNEVMLVRHTGSITGAPGVFHTPGFYTQFSRRFGKYHPYFRYAYLNAGVAEPIYGDPADGIVVNKSNNAGPLSREEVRRIFMGEKSSWPGGKRVTVLMLAADQPERGVILREVFKMNESDYTRYFLQAAFTGRVQAAPKDLPSAARMKGRLAANPNAIGYLNKGDVDDNVRVLLKLP